MCLCDRVGSDINISDQVSEGVCFQVKLHIWLDAGEINYSSICAQHILTALKKTINLREGDNGSIYFYGVIS